MSIQKELDNVRKKNLNNQILDIFDKLNKQCQDLTGGMDLEQLLDEVEIIHIVDTYGEDEEYDPVGEYSEYCKICDCITTFSKDSPYGTCDCS